MQHFECEPARRRLPAACPALLPALIRLLMTALLSAVPHAAGAAPPPPADATVRLGWQEAVRLAQGHPELAAAGHRVSEAVAAVAEARAVPNPTLEASGARAEARDQDLVRNEWEVSLEIPLHWLVRRGPGIAAAEAGLDAFAADAEARRREFLSRLAEAFWSLAHRQEQVAVLTALAEETSALERAVRFRVDKGEARPLEETRVRLEGERLAGDLAAARRELAVRRRLFALRLGMVDTPDVVVTADLTALPDPAALPDSAQIQAQIDAGHPTLQAERARLRNLDAERRLAGRDRFPEASVRPFVADELDATVAGIAVQFELPLGNFNSGAVARAEARLAAAERTLAADRLEMRAFAVEILADCRGGLELASRYRERILPLAEAAAATMDRAYLLGEAALFEVIDARRDLLQVRIAYLAVLAQAQIDCARLRTAVGEE